MGQESGCYIVVTAGQLRESSARLSELGINMPEAPSSVCGRPTHYMPRYSEDPSSNPSTELKVEKFVFHHKFRLNNALLISNYLKVTNNGFQVKYRDEDPLIFGLPDPDWLLFSSDPDTTCNNRYIKLYNIKTKINKFNLKMMVYKIEFYASLPKI